jgi:hypothetical protein
LLLSPVVACAGVLDAPRRQVRDPAGVLCRLTCGAQSGQAILGVSRVAAREVSDLLSEIADRLV